MTVLQRPDRPTTRPTDRPARASVGSAVARARALGLAAVAGALAALVSLLVVCLPVVLAWFFDDRSGVSLAQAAGIGVDVWALAHRGAVTVGGSDVVLAPLLLTLVPFLACRYAVNQVLVDRPETRGTLREVRGVAAAWRAVGGAEVLSFVAGYLAAGLVLASLAGLGQAPVRLGTVAPGLLLVPAAAVLAGLWREHRRQEHPTIERGLRWLEAHTPVLVRRGLRPATEAVLVLLAAGLLVVLSVLVLRAERIGSLYTALETGAVGTGVLTAAQLAALPNTVVWAVGWTAGVPVHVGSVVIGWQQSTPGDLPLIPVLAALPEPGALPPALWAVLLVPVLTGAWVGVRAGRAAPRLASWWTRAQIAISACLGAAAVLLALSWLASGGMSPGLLGLVGTEPLLAGGLLLGELLGGALVSVTVLHLVRRRI
jgi:Family of unknown function (DUF6350)